MQKSFPHQLILFYGSSPGAGKSTLSAFLHDQLTHHEIPVQWMYEDDVLHLHEFQSFVADIQSGNRALIQSLLAASTDYIQQIIETDQVLITDSIFPCFNWLIATGFYTHGQIQDFGRTLEQILRPLNPLVIYLHVDPPVALRRAVAQRSQQWLDDLLTALNSYGCHKEKPLQDADDVAAYFSMVGELSLRWLQEWESELLILDPARNDVAALKRALLNQVDLHEIAPPAPPETDILLRLTGIYACDDDTTMLDKRLSFEVIDGVLKIDSYWPNGCELVAAGGDRFRLRDTNRAVQFEQFQDRIPQTVVYEHGGGSCRYHRVDAVP